MVESRFRHLVGRERGSCHIECLQSGVTLFAIHKGRIDNAQLLRGHVHECVKVCRPQYIYLLECPRFDLPGDVLSAIAQLKNDRGNLEKFPARVVRLVADSIAAPLCAVYNLALSTDTIPAYLKCARVVALHKAGSKRTPC